MRQADRLTTVAQGLSPEEELKWMLSPKGSIHGYERVVKAIRQITVLEFELRGLFKGPDRDGPRRLRLARKDRMRSAPLDMEERLNRILAGEIRQDYSSAPYDEVVAGIRETLGAEAPDGDPFAAPTERKPQTANANRPVREVCNTPEAAPPKIADRIQPPRHTPDSAQEEPAKKVAVLAITKRQGKGFRMPPRTLKARRNRGPPK